MKRRRSEVSIGAIPVILTALAPLALVILHTIAIYLFLIACLALLGRREVAQLTPVELIIILVLGSAVETAMVAGNTSLPAGLVSAATLLIANYLLTLAVRRSRPLRHLLVGAPILLVHHGKLVPAHLRQAGLTEADVLQAMRERGFDDLAEVRDAVLEIDGSVGVIGKDAPAHQGRKVLVSSNRDVGQQQKAPSP